jgi:Predicted membrane protein/domain
VTVASRRARADRMRGRRAGLVSRLLADAMDLAVAGFILFGALVAFAVVRYMVGAAPLQLPRVSGIFTAAAFPITLAIYLSITWSGNGRSVGKALVGLRVVRNEGAPLGKFRATMRAVLCTLFGGLSLLWVLFSSRNAAVHDLVVHSTVVHDWSDEVRTEITPPEPTLATDSMVQEGATQGDAVVAIPS